MDGSIQAFLPVADQAGLSRQAIRADATSARPVLLSTLFADLVSGQLKIVSTFSSATRNYFVLESAPHATRDAGRRHRGRGSRSRLRDLRIVKAWFEVGSQKQVALDLGLSTSTVATATKRWLRSVGLSCLPSYVPTLLVMIGRSAEREAARADARLADLVPGEARRRVVSALRPDNQLESLLPPAEHEVVRLFLEGRSHREVALVRGSSPRTVANQLATVFHRFGVSGRAELVIHLLRADARGGTAGVLVTHPRLPVSRRPRRGSPAESASEATLA